MSDEIVSKAHTCIDLAVKSTKVPHTISFYADLGRGSYHLQTSVEWNLYITLTV